MNTSDIRLDSKLVAVVTSSTHAESHDFRYATGAPTKVRSSIWIQLILLFVAVVGFCTPHSAQATCIEDGGTEICRAAKTTPWSYGYCPVAGDFTFIDAAVCQAAGGTYTGSDTGCVGYTPLTEANLKPQVNQFGIIVNHNNASCGIDSDSGWGATLPSNILCWQGPPVYQGSVLVGDWRIFNMKCWPTVYAERDRQ